MAKKHKNRPVFQTLVTSRSDRDRRVRQNERIARVLSVLNLIQSRGRWDAKAIAKELECSERTVFRDLDVLEFAGVPWFFHEAESCYRVRPDYQFPVLALTEEEAIGQAVATTLATTPGLEPSVGAKGTTRKLAAASSDQVQQILEDSVRLIDVVNLKLSDHSKCRDQIQTAQLALLRAKRVTGTYRSPYESMSKRITVEPYRLCLIKQAWYLIGLVAGEETPKCFRMARFQSLRGLDQEAHIPEEFDLAEYFGNAWSVYRGATTYDVVLRFSPPAAALVTETIWHPTQEIAKRAGGQIDLSFQVDGLEEIVHWVLGWTGRVKVLEPEALKILVLDYLEKGVEINSQASND